MNTEYTNREYSNTSADTEILIIGSGPLPVSSVALDAIDSADSIIAADGGANHCAYLDIIPDYVIGDLDSIEPLLLQNFEKAGVTIQKYPRHKDATDLEIALDLAVDLALEKGAKNISLTGVLGGRWDMSFANIMLAAASKYSAVDITFYADAAVLKILQPGKTHLFKGYSNKTISFVPLNGAVSGVTLTGVAYPLADHPISFGSTLGVSNIIKDAEAEEHHRSGILLCTLL